MWRHNLLVTFRNLKRAWGSFFINAIGLSTSLACSMLIYLWINDELSVNNFHDKDSRLFQIMANYNSSENIETSEATPIPLAEALAKEMHEVEYAVTCTDMDSKDVLSVGDKTIKAVGKFVGEDFFKVFSYELMSGDKDQVLKDKNSIIISEDLGVRLFNTTDNIVGRVIEFRFKDAYTVAGVFKNVPSSSSVKFDFVLPFKVYEDIINWETNWAIGGPSTFVVLNESANRDNFSSKITNFIKSKYAESPITLFLQRYSDTYLYNKYENGHPVGGRIAYIRLFAIVAVLLLIIASINFMNLSTAKATRRLKEVGVKKVLGATRRALIYQFLSESLLMAFVSFLFAVLFIFLLLPKFNTITGKQVTMGFEPKLVLIFLSVTFVTGLFAGIYPAFYLSRFNPAAVLKGRLNNSPVDLWARNGLVVFQFTVSIILIIAVMVVYRQMEFVQSKNLGYEKDNVLYFKNEGRIQESLNTFLTEVKNISGVVNASSGSSIAGFGTTSGVLWEGKNPDEKISFEIQPVNYGMIETLNIKLAEGRSFSADFSADSEKIIFNETAVKSMGLKDPIGKSVKAMGKDLQIVGVVKDFHFQSLHQNVNPLFFILDPVNSSTIIIRVEGEKPKDVLAKIEKVYRTFNPDYIFDYKFLNEDYQAQYTAETRVSTLAKYFAGLTILISCLGVFGLAAFTTERRSKEIAIRKVLGATNFALVNLISGAFIRLVFSSILFAIPLGYLLTRSWLNSFAYRIDLEPWYFLGAGLVALLIVWITVGLLAVKAAHSNPVKNLKE